MLKLFLIVWGVFFIAFSIQDKTAFWGNVFIAAIPASFFSVLVLLCGIIYNAIK